MIYQPTQLISQRDDKGGRDATKLVFFGRVDYYFIFEGVDSKLFGLLVSVFYLTDPFADDYKFRLHFHIFRQPIDHSVCVLK